MSALIHLENHGLGGILIVTNPTILIVTNPRKSWARRKFDCNKSWARRNFDRNKSIGVGSCRWLGAGSKDRNNCMLMHWFREQVRVGVTIEGDAC